MTIKEQTYLPPSVLERALPISNELGWKRRDFDYVIEQVVNASIGIVGGQVQFAHPNGTCELYWHSYDTVDRNADEGWEEYCLRTKSECLKQFNRLPSEEELVKEGIESFEFLKEQRDNGVDISEYLLYIIYFEKEGG